MSTTPSEPNDPIHGPNEAASPPDAAAAVPDASPLPSAAPSAETPPATPPAGPYPQAGYWQPPPPVGAGYVYPAYDQTFAPVPRGPRSPWIAPQRRAAVAAIAVIAAVLLFGLGFLGGSQLNGGNGHHRPPAFGRAADGRPYAPLNGPNGRVQPRRPPSPSSSQAPAPVPSPTATS